MPLRRAYNPFLNPPNTQKSPRKTRGDHRPIVQLATTVSGTGPVALREQPFDCLAKYSLQNIFYSKARIKSMNICVLLEVLSLLPLFRLISQERNDLLRRRNLTLARYALPIRLYLRVLAAQTDEHRLLYFFPHF